MVSVPMVSLTFSAAGGELPGVVEGVDGDVGVVADLAVGAEGHVGAGDHQVPGTEMAKGHLARVTVPPLKYVAPL